MNYYIFNHIIDYLEPKEIIRFLLHSNKNIINSIDWDYLNSKFNYNDTPSNIIFPYNEGFNIFFNNYKFNIKQISCGYYHTFILKNDNTFWGSGYNNGGELDLGRNERQHTFVQLLQQDIYTKLLRRPINNIKSVSGGRNHTLILKNDNTLWGTGYNDGGQLGLGHCREQHTFVQILEQDTPAKLLRRPIDNIKSVHCGSAHTLILKNDDTLWGSGNNYVGQLGLGHTDNQHTFLQLLQQDTPAKLLRRPIDNVKSVSCGVFHTLILKNDDTLWGSGYNERGQLGLGHTNDQHIFVELPINNIKSVYCSYHYTLILKNDDTLWGAGDNDQGQLGLGHTNNQHTFVQLLQQDTHVKSLRQPINNIKSVSCGPNHTIILKNDNTLRGSGYNQYGQLGLGHTDDQHTFIQLLIDNIKSVSCGAAHIFILKNDNTLWCTGSNYAGQLGLGYTNSSNTFIQIHL
jgi:alpha-tubulin suppressor-like RCC1 family protein